MGDRNISTHDDKAAAQFNRMMNQENFKSMPFNPILHKFGSLKMESAAKEAAKKKTSWKSRNFLKVKVTDIGGKIYHDEEVPPAIRYLTSEEIRVKNTESAYNPIKFEGNQFSLPTAHRKRQGKDANHSLIVLDNKYRDSKAMFNYNREVSKRVRILKNNPNKFFARYEFDKRLKRQEVERNTSFENKSKSKLSFIREKELKRGYDILSLQSHFQEPRRERKLPYIQETVPEKERVSLDGYKPAVKPSIWDSISKTTIKRPQRDEIVNSLKSSHSIYHNNKELSRRHSNNLIKSS